MNPCSPRCVLGGYSGHATTHLCGNLLRSWESLGCPLMLCRVDLLMGSDTVVEVSYHGLVCAVLLCIVGELCVCRVDSMRWFDLM